MGFWQILFHKRLRAQVLVLGGSLKQGSFDSRGFIGFSEEKNPMIFFLHMSFGFVRLGILNKNLHLFWRKIYIRSNQLQFLCSSCGIKYFLIRFFEFCNHMKFQRTCHSNPELFLFLCFQNPSSQERYISMGFNGSVVLSCVFSNMCFTNIKNQTLNEKISDLILFFKCYS